MRKFRTIVVDDEQEAREGLKLLLSADPEIELLALCKNGMEAIRQIRLLQPELVFLDIQMPEINGFDVLNTVEISPMPSVIFVTAYDQYALKAFEIHALDYLLKPFSDERFYKALQHAKYHLQHTSLQQLQDKLISVLAEYNQIQKSSQQSDQLIEDPEPELQTFADRLVIKSMGKIFFVALGDLVWVEAFDYYVKIHTQDKFYLVRDSLKNLEKKLPPAQFLRLHKSSLVNMRFVVELEPHFNGEYIVKLSNGQKLKLSRNYKQALAELLKNQKI